MKILRWIAVLPAAVGCSFLCYALLMLLWTSGIFNRVDSPLSALFSECVANYIAGTLIPVVGAHVAPSHQKTTATVLASVFSTVVIIAFIFSLLMNGFVLRTLLGSVLGIAGAISGAIKMHSSSSLSNP